MDDAPATPKPRRRWKRRAALVLVLIIGFGAWMLSGESERVRRARNIQLGMSIDKVNAIMSEPGAGGPDGNDGHEVRFYYSVENMTLRSKAWHWLHRMGFDADFLNKRVDVAIHFDLDGRVASIRRGSEFVGR
jgi:hypothetical protein